MVAALGEPPVPPNISSRFQSGDITANLDIAPIQSNRVNKRATQLNDDSLDQGAAVQNDGAISEEQSRSASEYQEVLKKRKLNMNLNDVGISHKINHLNVLSPTVQSSHPMVTNRIHHSRNMSNILATVNAERGMRRHHLYEPGQQSVRKHSQQPSQLRPFSKRYLEIAMSHE